MKILIVILGRIGDMVLATPAFKKIKEQFPGAKIYVVASRHNAVVPRNDPNVHKVIVWHNSPFMLLKAVFQLASVKFTAHIDRKSRYSWQSQTIAKITRADKKIVYVSSRRKKRVNNRINVAELNPCNYRHFTEHVLVALSPLGISYDGRIPRPVLYTNEDSENLVETFLKQHGIGEYVFINISAGKVGGKSVELRSWQTGNWQKLVEAITSSGRFVLINAVPAQKEEAELIAAVSKKAFVSETRGVNDIISYVKRAAVVISPDTSVVHISAAFDKPLVVMFPNNEHNMHRFYPTNTIREILLPGAYDTSIKLIEVTQVIEAYKRIVGNMGEATPSHDQDSFMVY